LVCLTLEVSWFKVPNLKRFVKIQYKSTFKFHRKVSLIMLLDMEKLEVPFIS